MKHIFNSVIKISCDYVEINWEMPFMIKDQKNNSATGFIINKEGYVITAAHVANSSKKIWGFFSKYGKKPIPLQLIGCYPEFDIALLKLTKKFLSKHTIIDYLSLGNSDHLQFEENVTALGYPTNTDNLKITKGIISGKEDFLIQTDTALNPGNSGGPLLNSKNEVVGINVAIMKDKDNIGYAVPINIYKNVADLLKKEKILFKPVLGALYSNLNDSYFDYHSNILCKSGIVLNKIFKNSPLYKTAIQEKDIICSINGNLIDNYGEIKETQYEGTNKVSEYLSKLAFNSTITIKYWSHQRTEINTISIIPTTSDKIYKIREKYPIIEPITYTLFQGIVFMELCLNHLIKEEFQHLGFLILNSKHDQNYIIVTKIMNDSPLHRENILTQGDIITKVNGDKFNNLVNFEKILQKNKGEFNILEINNNKEIYIRNA